MEKRERLKDKNKGGDGQKMKRKRGIKNGKERER